MTRTHRKMLALALALGAGTLFQAYPYNGCTQYYAYFAVSALDFCSVLNCTGGSFFNFCSPTQLLIDCP